ncbi:MAG TPA: hypothetical protein VNE39_12645 [Planctomycetota bacterium]|nr:hypothetical protein [Planctomycetota bacterium]
MPSTPFTPPTGPTRLPLWTRLKARVQIAVERALPPRWLFALSAQAARAALALNPKRRRRLERLLGHLTPAGTPLRELRRQAALSRAVRQHGVRSFAPVARRSREWLLRVLRPEGLEHLDAVKRSGSGAILVHAHIGHLAWEAPVLCGLGYPVKFVQRRATAPTLYLLLRREGLLGEVLPYPSAGEEGLHLKRLLDLLRRGTWLQHVGDAPDPETGLLGMFFGHPIRCARAPWVLSRLSGAPVIPTLILTDAECRFRLIIGEPAHVGGAGKALEAAFQSYLDFLARHLARAPWNIRMSHWETLLLQTPGAAAP